MERKVFWMAWYVLRGFWKNKYQISNTRAARRGERYSCPSRAASPVGLRFLLSLKWAVVLISKESLREITRKGLWLPNLPCPHPLPSTSHLKAGRSASEGRDQAGYKNWTFWLHLMPRISVPFKGNIIENSQMAKAKSPTWPLWNVFINLPCLISFLFLLK